MTSRKEGVGLYLTQVHKAQGIQVWQRGERASEKVQICVTSFMTDPKASFIRADFLQTHWWQKNRQKVDITFPVQLSMSACLSACLIGFFFIFVRIHLSSPC